VSLVIRSDVPIVAERSMYFQYDPRYEQLQDPAPGVLAPWVGGTTVVGATQRNNTWMFPEGTTRKGFDEWLMVMNPSDDPIDIELELIPLEGVPVRHNIRVPAFCRETVSVDRLVREGKDVSAVLTSDAGFVAERSQYGDFKGNIDGGESAMGSNLAALEWLFSEGCTLDGFTEYFTIMNPNDRPAELEIEYMDPSSKTPLVKRRHRMAAKSRTTIDVGRDLGALEEIAALLKSDLPIVVERVIYFSYFTLEGSTTTAGRPDYSP